jgi:isopentenyldiphosphate isomerase
MRRKKLMIGEESFYLVDEKDQVIPNLLVDKAHLHKSDKFHRAVHVLIEIFGGRLIIQKKAAHTENGGKWSSSASGHVRANETYEEAAIRETKEELGLELDRSDLDEITKIAPSEATGNEFVTLYYYLMDPENEKIDLSSDEVDEVIICPLGNVIDDVDTNGEEYSPAFIAVFNKFLTLEKGMDRDV